jgi:nucleoid-associated protein YgaU
MNRGLGRADKENKLDNAPVQATAIWLATLRPGAWNTTNNRIEIGLGGGVNRNVLIGVLAVGLAFAAILYFTWPVDEAEQKSAAKPPAESSSATDSAATSSSSDAIKKKSSSTAGVTDSASPGAKPSSETDGKTPAVVPSFDVVRVTPAGEAVIAGRAAPGSKVKIYDRKKLVGETTANGKGEWVLVPKGRLNPGDANLSISAERPDGTSTASEKVVVLMVPKEIVPSKPAPQGQAARKSTQPQSTQPQSTQPQSTQPQSTQPQSTQPQSTQPKSAPPESAAVQKSAPQSRQPIAVLVPRDGAGPATILQEPQPGPGVGTDSLRLQVIDYDEKGNLTLGGKGQPHAFLRAYLDNKVLGEADVPEDGKWQLRPDGPVAPGTYRLRIDQLVSGKVAQRIELPFTRSRPISELPGDTFVVVQPGNSLWRLARRSYGDGVLFSVIYQANLDQIRDPDLIYPGQVFALPTSKAR